MIRSPRSQPFRTEVAEPSPGSSHRPASSILLFAAAALALVAFHLVGYEYLDGFTLDLGSLNYPTPRYLGLVAFWMPLGALSAVLLSIAVARWCSGSDRFATVAGQWNALSDQRFLLWACVAALVIPLAMRRSLLNGAPLADDESAYRFAAELLASGRLWVPSPALKLFFDQNFMINDGRLYPVYFLGWPALLVPGVWVGAPGIVNSVLSALTVPPLMWAFADLVGRQWARAGVVIFLSAPFIQISAATGLAHTSCLMALTWCLWMYLRTTKGTASPRDHAGFALSFALAFCIRPQSALPLGLPLIVAWVVSLTRLDRGRRLRCALAFLLPSASLAALFLGSLWAQNGSPWLIGYSRYCQYLIENGFRFSTFNASDLAAMPGFDFSQIGPAIARTAVGLFRLNADLFGWFCSLALLPFAVPIFSSRIRILWAMLGSYFLLLMFQHDWGIDTFGPVHAFEASLPIIGLTVAGASTLGRLSAKTGTRERTLLAPSLVAALIVTAWLGFVPIRLAAVGQIARHVNTALEAPERAGIDRAVVFAPFPFAPRCGGVPSHFVLFRPVNDPDLVNPILWVNHVSLSEDRRLVESLGDRPGYVMRWTPRCEVTLVPLSSLSPGDPGGAGRLR
jgi:hypothetical protein